MLIRELFTAIKPWYEWLRDQKRCKQCFRSRVLLSQW